MANKACRQAKDYMAALGVLDMVEKLPLVKERGYIPQAMLARAYTQRDAGDLVASTQEAQKLVKWYADRPAEKSMGLCFQAHGIIADICQREGKFDDAIKELESTRGMKLDDEQRMSCENQIASLYMLKKDYAKALEVLDAARAKYPKAASITSNLFRAAEAHAAAGDLPSARKSLQAIIETPDADQGQVKLAKDKLAAMEKASTQPK
jgi:tetratricopeptide (TPR) repeat protein